MVPGLPLSIRVKNAVLALACNCFAWLFDPGMCCLFFYVIGSTDCLAARRNADTKSE